MFKPQLNLHIASSAFTTTTTSPPQHHGPGARRGNYQVRSLAGAGDGKAYLEDGPKAARRLLGAKAVLEQLDVVLTAGAHGHDAADETGRVRQIFLMNLQRPELFRTVGGPLIIIDLEYLEISIQTDMDTVY
jgi:hypothetical protein